MSRTKKYFENFPRLPLYTILPWYKDNDYIIQFWCSFGGDLSEFAIIWNMVFNEFIQFNETERYPKTEKIKNLLTLPIEDEETRIINMTTLDITLFDLIVNFRNIFFSVIHKRENSDDIENKDNNQ